MTVAQARAKLAKAAAAAEKAQRALDAAEDAVLAAEEDLVQAEYEVKQERAYRAELRWIATAHVGRTVDEFTELYEARIAEYDWTDEQLDAIVAAQDTAADREAQRRLTIELVG